MLAYHIKYVFDCKKRIASVTKKAQEHARITHDPMINSSGVMAIYPHQIHRCQERPVGAGASHRRLCAGA